MAKGVGRGKRGNSGSAGKSGFYSKITVNDKVFKELKKTLIKLNRVQIKTGWINGEKYPSSNKGSSRSGSTVATIAYANEFGSYAVNNSNKTVYIPSRPYFRQGLNNVPSDEVFEKYYKHVFDAAFIGDWKKVQSELGAIGKRLVWNIEMSISKQNYQKLSPKTVAIKGHDKQWVDSGLLVSNITYSIGRFSNKSGKF